MRGFPDATRDQQVFWDDRFYQMVFGIYLMWFLDVMPKTARIWEAPIILADSREINRLTASEA
jgi:hypothetical protein